MTDRERVKASNLTVRTTALKETFVTQQLNHLIDVGYKVEIEAVAALGQGYLTERYLKTKLTSIMAEEWIFSFEIVISLYFPQFLFFSSCVLFPTIFIFHFFMSYLYFELSRYFIIIRQFYKVHIQKIIVHEPLP